MFSRTSTFTLKSSGYIICINIDFRDRVYTKSLSVMYYVGDHFFTFVYLRKITVHCRTQISHLGQDELQYSIPSRRQWIGILWERQAPRPGCSKPD